MSHFKKIALLIALCVLAGFLVVSGGCTPKSLENTGNLLVLVVGADNGPLAGAKVISNIQPEGQSKVTGSTNTNGTVIYKGLKPGEYEFYVSRFDYEQIKFSVNIAANQATGITITLVRAQTPQTSSLQPT